MHLDQILAEKTGQAYPSFQKNTKSKLVFVFAFLGQLFVDLKQIKVQHSPHTVDIVLKKLMKEYTSHFCPEATKQATIWKPMIRWSKRLSILLIPLPPPPPQLTNAMPNPTLGFTAFLARWHRETVGHFGYASLCERRPVNPAHVWCRCWEPSNLFGGFTEEGARYGFVSTALGPANLRMRLQ